MEKRETHLRKAMKHQSVIRFGTRCRIAVLSAVLFLCVSCTDPLGPTPRPSDREIGLSAVTAAPTKAPLSQLPSDAVLSLSASISGAADSWFTDVDFSRSGEVWKGVPAKFWPLEGTLDFLCWWTPTLSPTSVTWGTPSASSLTLAVPSNKTAQDDFLIGWARSQSQSSVPVPMVMHHAMSQVAFTARCESAYDAATNSGVTLKGITILGAADRGTCRVDPAAGTIAWSALAGTSDVAVGGIASQVLTTTAAAAGTPYLLPGQAARGFKVYYTLHNGLKADGTTPDDNDCVFVYEQPSGAEAWQPGRKYVYALNVSLDGIEVALKVRPWDTAPSVPVEVQGAPDETLDYLTFDVTGDGRITWKATTEGAARNIEYSVNGAAWQQITSTTDGEDVIVHEGDVVKWRGANATYYDDTHDPETSGYSAFGTADGAMFTARGNAMSLVDPVGFESLTAFASGTENNFRCLFKDCGGITDASAMELPVTSATDSCYARMFSGCAMLSVGPALPATTLGRYCYSRMFEGCSGLVEAPALRATRMNTGCYQYMFSGCISLDTAPDLMATTLATYCYYHMFDGCVSLVSVQDELPAMTVSSHAYRYMYYGCASLRRGPRLPATTVNTYGYAHMFADCVSLEVAPALPATTIGTYSYYYMFQNCAELTEVPALPASTMKSYCYAGMFYGCHGLTAVPVGLLHSTSLASYCYREMFRGCNNLTVAPDLPATTTTDGTYYYMFLGCSSLTATPTMAATYIGYQTCYGMFYQCTSLVSASDLTATRIYGTYSYNAMFYQCKSLVHAPEIAAEETSITNPASIFHSMFRGCTALETPPSRIRLKAVGSLSFYQMFYGCTNLQSAPVLDLEEFTGGTQHCLQMFYNCKALVHGPVLRVAAPRERSYYQMFYGCTNLEDATCLATNISGYQTFYTWLSNLGTKPGRVFYQAASMEDGGEGTTKWPRSTSGIPASWTVASYTE